MAGLTDAQLNERRTFFHKLSQELWQKVLALEAEIIDLTSRLVECEEKRKIMKETWRRQRALGASLWQLDMEFSAREMRRREEEHRMFNEELNNGTRHGCGCLVKPGERATGECIDCYYTYGDGAD